MLAGMPVLPLPETLLAAAARGPAWAAWLERLPGTASGLLADWDLRRDGPATHGHCSLVLPVRAADGAPAVLKVTYDGDEESADEGLALQRWGGRGAVRLLRADPHRRALLLERLTPVDLSDHWDLEACEIVGGLYPRLHVPAPVQMQRLSAYVERWTAPLAELPRDAPIPRRMVEQTRSLVPDLLGSGPFASTSGEDLRIVHGDLHFGNVLAAPDVAVAAGREPWLAIDPKAMAGDPHYEPAPLLWTRWEELVDGVGGVRDGVRRRFHTLVDTAGLDEARARDWVVVRMVHNAHWAIADARRAGRALTGDERAWITRCVTIAKAVQD